MKPRKTAQQYCCIFLLMVCGFTALGYQLCWIRICSSIFGSGIGALSTVTAAFFAGIAIGSYIFGRLSTGPRDPLLTFGILETLTGIICGCTFLLLQWSAVPLGFIFRTFPEASFAFAITRTLLVMCIIAPASIFIGGAWPVLSQAAAGLDRGKMPAQPAVLYAASTIGSLGGCLAVGLVLLPYIGSTLTYWIQCGASIALGILTLALLPWFRRVAEPSDPGSDTPGIPVLCKNDTSVGSHQFPAAVLYALFFITGLAAMGYEILWTRFLSLIIHVTVYTYVFSLSAMLLGIAAGSILAIRLRVRHAPATFAIVNILIGLFVAAILLRPPGMWDWAHTSTSVWIQALLCIAAFAVPSILMGISFPTALAIAKSDPALFGKQVGTVTAINTLGGIIGSLGTGLFCLPVLGMHTTLVILTNASIIVGCIAFLHNYRSSRIALKAAIACSAVLIWCGILLLSKVVLPDDFLGRTATLLEVKEGASSFLAVVKRDKQVSLEIDGMWQGQQSKDYQILAAHIPMLLHQAPKSVLVIGVGAGQTAARFLLYDIENLDCVDIEGKLPGILHRHFDGAWLNDPRVRFIAEDGRNVISYSRATYDVISIESGQTFRPSVASLYTYDFYRKAAARLRPDGIICQFVPIGFMSLSEFASVVRTFIEVFPASTLWFNKHAELILIGSCTTIPQLTQRRIALMQSDSAIFRDLSFSFSAKRDENLSDPDNFAANYLMGKDGLCSIAKKGAIYRDDMPILEYRSAQIPYSPARFHGQIEQFLDTNISTKAAALRQKNVHEALLE